MRRQTEPNPGKGPAPHRAGAATLLCAALAGCAGPQATVPDGPAADVAGGQDARRAPDAEPATADAADAAAPDAPRGGPDAGAADGAPDVTPDGAPGPADVLPDALPDAMPDALQGPDSVPDSGDALPQLDSAATDGAATDGAATDSADGADVDAGATLACPDGMVLVPAGPFVMGVDGMNPEAGPAHEVTLSAFCIGATEVTVAQWQACVDAGACFDLSSLALCATNDPWRPSSCRMGMEAHPVNYVSWQRAAEYCAFAGGALPTEAQWEKAARGTGGPGYPWGPAIDCAVAVWGQGPVFADCVPPGQFLGWTVPADSLDAGASPYGALHMGGNVDEWTADWYSAITYAGGPAEDPTGPATGTFHVYRGGGFLSPDFELLTWFRRAGVGDSNASATSGLRCVAAPAIAGPP